MSEQEPGVLSPPTEQSDMPEQESTWPKTIGVISLIYAIGGLLCQVGAGVMAVAGEWVLSLFQIEVEFPIIVKLTGSAMAVVIFVIGIFMLAGSIRLLQRKQTGPSLLKTWSVFRLAMVLFALVVSILIAPAQIEFERSMLKFQNEKRREVGQKPVKIDDQKLQTKVMLSAVIGAGVFSIYPLFLGFYLSRKKITEEVNTW